MILPSKPLFEEVFINFIQFPNFCRIKKKEDNSWDKKGYI
jgi:hypothetical protein